MRRKSTKRFVFNVVYFPTLTCDVANGLVIGEINVHHAKVDDGNMKGAAQVSVDNALSRHGSMMFGHIWVVKEPLLGVPILWRLRPVSHALF